MNSQQGETMDPYQRHMDILHKNAGAYERQMAVIGRLGVEVTPDYVTEDPDKLLGFVERVLDEEGITRDDFIELDSRPGQYDGGYNGLFGEWHFRIRQWRNSDRGKAWSARHLG